MKKIPGFPAILLLAVLVQVCGMLSAEDTMSPPLEHKKKVFVDEKENFLYWPMSMPFWVRLTPSPEENAPSFLLKKVYPSDSKQAEMYKKNGIKLEIEGQQFIRWFNKITNETTYLKFFADGKPPVTKETLTGAPKWVEGDHVYYGVGLKGTLASADETSGVQQVYLSLDGAEFAKYEGQLSFDTEKDVNWRFYAVDRVGYAETPLTVRFTVDLTSPDTRHDVHTNFIGDVLSTSSTVQLSGKDKLSGLKTIFYHIDDQAEPSIYKDAEIKLDGLSDGEHKVTYYSDDNVLNREKKNTYSFYLDRIPPVATSKFEVDHHREGDTDFISERTKINLSATDNKIGVDKIEYIFTEDFKPGDNTKKSKRKPKKKKDKTVYKYETYSEPFLTPFKSGHHLVTFRSVDKLRNMCKEVLLPVRMDTTPPVSKYSIEGAKYRMRDTIWITKDTKVLLSAKDDAAGVRGIYYQLGMKTELNQYEQPIVIAEEGRYLFKFHGVDHVSNKEKDQPYILVVDNSPPKLMMTFSVTHTGTEKGEGEEEIKIFPRYTSLFLGAMDNSVGIKGIWYTMNGSKEIEYKTPLMFNEDGEFSMTIRLEDNVGNTVTESVRFIIKEQ